MTASDMALVEFVVVTDDTTRADLLELLDLINRDAKAISRRGKSARLRPEYAKVHAMLNDVLTDLQAQP